MKRALVRMILPFLIVTQMASCLRPTDIGMSTISLTGAWQYSAVETGPLGATLSGTLVIVQQTGASVQGSLEVSSRSTATGEVRSLAGAISGSAPGPGAIDFDVYLEPTARRHVAQLSGDTLRGTWVRSSDRGVAASGTFAAYRLR
jgi:hypothetical protein